VVVTPKLQKEMKKKGLMFIPKAKTSQTSASTVSQGGPSKKALKAANSSRGSATNPASASVDSITALSDSRPSSVSPAQSAQRSRGDVVVSADAGHVLSAGNTQDVNKDSTQDKKLAVTSHLAQTLANPLAMVALQPSAPVTQQISLNSLSSVPISVSPLDLTTVNESIAALQSQLLSLPVLIFVSVVSLCQH
jgi:hypothetical protein